MLKSTISKPQIVEGGGGRGNTPFFSLIILSYNKEPFIRKCLESCINQTFKDIEIIVVDDCSQDNTLSILQEYKVYENLIIIQNPSNSGAFASRIVGEQHAKGKYIIHIDGDDFVKDTMCEILYPYCKTDQWDIIGFGWTNIALDGKYTDFFHPIGEYAINQILCNIGIPTFAFRFNAIEKNLISIAKLFQTLPKLSNLEDKLHAILIALHSNKFLGITQTLYYYQTNLQSTTGDCKNPKKNKRKVQEMQCSLSMILNLKHLISENQQDIMTKIYTTYNPLIKQYQYIYYHSKAYENKPFAYPINFLKSLWYTRSPKVIAKTLARVFVYFVTLGRIKI